MSQSHNDGHRHLSSFSTNEGYSSSSQFDLEPSVIDAVSEKDFGDSWQNAEKPPQIDFKVSLKNDRTNGLGESKIKLSFEDLGQKNPVELKANPSDGSLGEKLIKNELPCPEDGEVVESDEASEDLEEGEILETPNDKSVDTYNCRYYQMGFCLYGKDCRFFHVSDKGLYNMIDLSVPVQNNNVRHPSQFVLKQKSVPPASEVGETSWDRALKEAMARIDSKKKVPLDRENLRMTIQSVNCIDKKLTIKESKNSFSQTYVRNTSDSSRSRRKPAYETTCTKRESSAKERIDMPCSFKRSKTPRDLRWSPKSVSCSSQSRSRSRSSCRRLSSSCSCTASPKRGRRILSSRVSGSYWKRKHSWSSKSSSPDFVSKTISRRFKGRRRESRSHYKSTKTSDCRSPVKILLPKRLERESCRLSRRDIPRRAIESNFQVAIKSTSYTRSCDKSCSDMSISPLSNSSNPKDDHLDLSVVCCSSDRHVSDMSISPLSDVSSPSRFSDQVEGKGVSNAKVENLGKNISGQALAKSDPLKNISEEISVCNSSNLSKLMFDRKRKKDNQLVTDIMKIHRNFKSDDFVEQVKNKPKTHVKTASEFVDKPTNDTQVYKVKQKTNITQSNPSKKEILMKRLQEINAAIERKKFT